MSAWRASGPRSPRLTCLIAILTDLRYLFDVFRLSSKLYHMEAMTSGSYLSECRKRQRRSLQDVARRVARKAFSKQALSLIERGRMRIPAARLRALKRAYRLSVAEEAQLERLCAFEKLVEHTGEEKEFGEAVLSVVDPAKASSIFVIGGRVLSLTSPLLQEKAAEFLQRPDNRLIFLYPYCKDVSVPGAFWFPNSRREMLEMQASIQTFSRRRLTKQVEFYGIDVTSVGGDLLLLSGLSLCSPFTATTIATSSATHHVAGYVFVEGPKDRWVLLKAEHARRVLTTITRLVERATENKGVIKEHLG